MIERLSSHASSRIGDAAAATPVEARHLIGSRQRHPTDAVKRVRLDARVEDAKTRVSRLQKGEDQHESIAHRRADMNHSLVVVRMLAIAR